jgi:nucleoside phosphorylase
MIAVTFAHPSESRDFLRLLGGRHREVRVLHTGVGPVVCRERIESFLDSERVDFLISRGFAGAVDDSLAFSDLIVAENFSDRALLQKARAVVICRVARLVTAERVIEDAAERARWAREHGANAVDMETESIAQACARREIPLLSLRAISDTAALPFPAPADILFDLEEQRTRSGRLTRYLLTHPLAIVRLMRFARRIAAARAELAIALKQLVETL